MNYLASASEQRPVASAHGTQDDVPTHAIDNSAIGQPEFREHKATYGLVFRLAKDVTDVLDAKIYPPLRERLVKLGLVAEARTFNLQHVTVIHVHNADPSTPQKMLIALPKEGLKYSGDEDDAAYLAQLLRLGILHSGYIITTGNETITASPTD